jgi:hypothetical protein
MALTDLKIQSIKPLDTPQKIVDGDHHEKGKRFNLR